MRKRHRHAIRGPRLVAFVMIIIGVFAVSFVAMGSSTGFAANRIKDVSIVDIVSKDTLIGDVSDFMIKIKNNGDDTPRYITYSINYGDGVVEEHTIDVDIPPGGTYLLPTFSHVYQRAGEYMTTGKVTEMYDYNILDNSKTIIQRIIYGGPDLVFTDFKQSNNNGIADFEFRILNAGDYASEPSVIYIELGDGSTKMLALNNIEPNTLENIGFSHVYSEDGVYSFRALIESNDINTGNNYLLKNVIVG